MIHELRTYTFDPGNLPKYLKLGEEVGRPVRGNDYGMNHGYWTSEFGTVNQIWHLWSYKDLNERERLRGELAKNERWTKEYVPQIRPLMQRQEIRLLKPAIELNPPPDRGNVYELRIYRTQVGMVGPWLQVLKEFLPVRQKYSPIVGLWQTEAPQPNEVVHLWVYKDLNHRAEARAAVAADPGWQDFLGKSAPLLTEMQAIVLMPTSYSSMA